MNAWSLRLAPLASIIALTACSAEPTIEPSQSPRPVLSVIATASASRNSSFAGTIAPRHETNFAFRVLGRLIARDAAVGMIVKRGDRLAALDPLALRLPPAQAKADVANAEAALAKAEAASKKGKARFCSVATSRLPYSSRPSSRAKPRRRPWRKPRPRCRRRRSSSYTPSCGRTPMASSLPLTRKSGRRCRRASPSSPSPDLPIEKWSSTSPTASPNVASQLDGSITAFAKIREKAPQAVPATRTPAGRLRARQSAGIFRIGATIYARSSPMRPAPPSAFRHLALLSEGGKARVLWSTRPVRVYRPAMSKSRPIASQAQDVATAFEIPESRIATAGVHAFEADQRVKIPRT